MTNYEFSNTENMEFLKFIKRSVLLAFAMIFAGILLLIEGVIPTVQVGDIFIGFIFVIVGIALMLPMQSFLNIIITEGNDVDELMNGLTSFSNGMKIVAFALGINFIIIFIQFIGAAF